MYVMIVFVLSCDSCLEALFSFECNGTGTVLRSDEAHFYLSIVASGKPCSCSSKLLSTDFSSLKDELKVFSYKTKL